jgi:Domain of unknown function (DUF1918)
LVPPRRRLLASNLARQHLAAALPMKAEVGDELIIDSLETGRPSRTGTITALTNKDGSPPYVSDGLLAMSHWSFQARACGS